ncbi:MAG: V-type ATP synthase subunit I [Methanospirillum sp.]|nr:V-type ATP synthase subunit I [Methanospirillum sp.]
MLYPEQMSRLLITGTKDQMGKVIAELHRRRLFHIEDFVGQEEYDGFKIGMPLEGATEASVDLLKIRGAATAFGVEGGASPPARRVSSGELRRQLETELPELDAQADEMVTRRNRLENRARELETRIAELEPFTAFPVDLDHFRGYESLAVFTGRVPADVAIEAPHEKEYAGGRKGGFLAVFTPKEHRDAVERQLQEAGFAPVALPAESGPAGDAIARYRAELADVKKELETIDRQLHGLKEIHSSFLLAADELLSADVEQAEAPLRFAVTDLAFVAEGWVPTEAVSEITASLEEATGEKVHVETLPVDYENDQVPVEFQNPDFAHPTEMFMDVYSRPDYREIDPTLLVSIVFPIFFGIILGDVGYGLILLAISLMLRRFLMTDGWKQFLDNMRNASISAIVFGVLYSEFLGFALPWDPVIFSRHLNIGGGAHGHGPDAASLLIVAIWIGILHITLGRIISLINHARMDHGTHRTKAMIAQTGWIAFMWGLLLVIWSIFPIPLMFDLTRIGDVVALGMRPFGIIGIALILYGMIAIGQENALELVEAPTVISHVLSYARLVAVGLSSVAIAMVVNYISIGMMIEPALKNLTPVAIVLVIVGIVVFLIGHALNTALGILGGGLHSIRLHYVEFFTKFYKGGGLKYNPFGMKRQYTTEE